jgi:RHS repeat-associated protein
MSAATDAAGNIVWKENYRPFGDKVNNQSAAADNRQWFHGKAADADTGLQYFGARYYDPVLGRFMGVDPVGFQEDNIHSFNKYAYGNNNPYKYIDKDGKYAELVFEAVSITVGFKSLIENARAGNYGAAFVDGGGIVADVIGAALPGVPGVAGLGIKASREAAEVGAQAASKAFTKEIGAGHAFEKHVVQQGEFKGLGIRTRDQFVSHIENVVGNPTATRNLSGGRTGYWHEGSSTVVIRNPRASDSGTAFQPTNGRAYFDGLR